MRYTIDQLQRAMAYWGEREGPGDGVSIGPVVGALADVWGLMVYEKRTEVDAEALTAKQRDALQEAGV